MDDPIQRWPFLNSKLTFEFHYVYDFLRVRSVHLLNRIKNTQRAHQFRCSNNQLIRQMLAVCLTDK